MRIINAFLLLLLSAYGFSQPNHASRYVFYFHGAVVTELGDNAVNQSMPEWGPYEYSNILDSLHTRGFIVFSEIRKKGVDDSYYINKLEKQVDSLFSRGVKPSAILLLGASAGSHYVLKGASLIGNDQLKVAIMGACRSETYKYYADLKLQGNYLSIIERSDPHKTCEAIFKDRSEVSDFREVELNTGLSHGFIYKGYAAWLDPLMQWFNSDGHLPD